MTNQSGPAPTDPYNAVLDDLRRRRADIDRAIEALEALTPAGSAKVDSNQPVNNQPDGPYAGMSVHEATTALLMARGRVLGNVEIAAAIQAGGVVMNSADPVNTVGAILTRRASLGIDIVKEGRGVWGLKAWRKYRVESNSLIPPDPPEEPEDEDEPSDLT